MNLVILVKILNFRSTCIPLRQSIISDRFLRQFTDSSNCFRKINVKVKLQFSKQLIFVLKSFERSKCKHLIWIVDIINSQDRKSYLHEKFNNDDGY